MRLVSKIETTRAWEQRSRATARAKKPRRPKDSPELEAAKVVVHARSGGRCELQLAACQQRAVAVHHRAHKDWAGCHNPELLLDLCQHCHDGVHIRSATPYTHGWLVRRPYAMRNEYEPSSALALRAGSWGE